MDETTISRAWLLDFGKGLRAAVGAHEMSQVLLSVTLHDIPCTPMYASEVFVFQEMILPVLDVYTLIRGQRDEMTVHLSAHIIGLILYQLDPDDPAHYGGLRLTTLPVNLFVDDSQFCPLPAQLDFWRPLAISCFNLNDNPIPIIDLGRLFSGHLQHSHFAGKS
jgi:chemotaxis signal transduction protein